MLVGMVEVQSGLQLSCGEWPHRLAPGIVAAAQSHAGDRERRLHMNVGEGLDVSVDVDVNEPAWLREGETGQEEKKGEEKVVNSEKRQKEDHQALRKNRDENTQRESMMESVRQETQTHVQTNRLNNTDQKPPPPHKDSSSSTWTHREMGPLNDGKSQQTHTERALVSSIVVPELCDKHPLHSVSQHPVSLALNIASNFESARGPSPQVHNNLMHVFICKYVFVSSTMY